MLNEILLPSYPGLRTQDPDEMSAYLSPLYSVTLVDVPRRPTRAHFMFNHCRLSSIAMTFAYYGAPFKAHIRQADYFAQGFPLSGRGRVEWAGQQRMVSCENGGLVGEPESDGMLEYEASFSTLALKIPPRTLARTLSAITGIPIERNIRFAGKNNPALVERQRRLMLFLAREVESSIDHLQDPVIAEIEDAIVVNYLMQCAHNYSDLLERKPLLPAPWQVRRAVDYMEAHWNQPITIETLTRITGSSASSLFHLFKKTYHMSPMVYLGKVRLRHARKLLSRPEPGTSVTKVGFMCGFSNMGNFAMRYFAAFGEKPSETFRKSMGLR